MPAASRLWLQSPRCRCSSRGPPLAPPKPWETTPCRSISPTATRTGIYSYDYLRTICPCEECASVSLVRILSAPGATEKRTFYAERAIIAAETSPLSTKMPPVANNIHPAHWNGAHARESMMRPARTSDPPAMSSAAAPRPPARAAPRSHAPEDQHGRQHDPAWLPGVD